MDTRVITNPDGTLGLEEYVVNETVLEDYTREDGTAGQRLVMTTESGFGAIYESGVLTETHRFHVKAFDRAGNEAESEPIQILVMHKPEEEPEAVGARFDMWADRPEAAILNEKRSRGRG